MEVHIKLTKKTTILCPPDLHQRLCQLAEQRGTSLGELVRRACIQEYGVATREERVATVHGLAAVCSHDRGVEALPVARVVRLPPGDFPDPRSSLACPGPLRPSESFPPGRPSWSCRAGTLAGA